MRHILVLMAILSPSTCQAQWGNYGYRPRPYVQMPIRVQPLHPAPIYSSQTVYLPNATFYQDSYGNSGMSVWSGNARFDSFNQVRPIPRTNWWGW